MHPDRKALADHILRRIAEVSGEAKSVYQQSAVTIGYFFIDDLLPQDIALKLNEVFPKPQDMVLKKSLREDKYIGVQMNAYHPLLEEAIYAFQDKRVVEAVGRICQTEAIQPDENLYAGGLSLMAKDQFLNPHLDNSHDKDRQLWRVFNLLYYVTPDWEESYGGNLELWPGGMNAPQVTIWSRFNRLAVMATHGQSLHSVSPVVYDGSRCCISNYYFSDVALQPTDRFHVTSFRGRPENKFTDLLLRADALLRMGIRKVFRKGIKENPHVYKKDQ